MKTELIKYIRKNNTPIACLLAIKDKSGRVLVGFSKYHTSQEKEPFNKEVAKKLALSRARNSHLYTIHQEWNWVRKTYSFTPTPNFPESMGKEVKEFIERAMKYFVVDEISNSYVVKKHKKETPSIKFLIDYSKEKSEVVSNNAFDAIGYAISAMRQTVAVPTKFL